MPIEVLVTLAGMTGKRERVAQLLDRAGVWKAVLWARQRAPSPWLTVLTYHRVNDPGGSDVFDADVIDATPERFEQQVAFLTRNFRIVGIEEICAFAKGGTLPKNAVAITFDDGYLDCHDVVLPILRRYGAKAIFFIATDYTEQRKMFWWDRIAFQVRESKRTTIEIEYPKKISIDISEGRDGALKQLLRVVKTSVGMDLDRYIEGIVRATGVTMDRDRERAIADQLLMTWEQIVDMERAGMDIQSHTSSHRVLGTLEPAQLSSELLGSRVALEEKLQKPVRAVAYPVGYSIAADRVIRNAVLEAGYEVGFTNQSGVNHVFRGVDPLDISRHAMERDMGGEMFRGLMAFPYLARTRG